MGRKRLKRRKNGKCERKGKKGKEKRRNWIIKRFLNSRGAGNDTLGRGER